MQFGSQGYCHSGNIQAILDVSCKMQSTGTHDASKRLIQCNALHMGQTGTKILKD